MKARVSLLVHLLLACAGAALAQSPDTVLVNGKIVTADERGALHEALAVREGVGKLADLAVLSGDYLTVPVQDIGAIHSLLTMVGGRVVHAEGGFAGWHFSNYNSGR